MSVEQNIAFGLKQDKMPKGEIDARVEEMFAPGANDQIRQTQAAPTLWRSSNNVSTLARSLAKRPKILLLVRNLLGALDKKTAPTNPTGIGQTRWNKSA